MPSTKPPVEIVQIPAWREAGLRYHSYNFALKRRFRQRVQKVSIDAGFTCPNVDGTVAKGGCAFCDNRSFSPSRRLPRADVRGQIDQSIARMQKRYQNCSHYLAYFQPATNTYAPVDRLRPLYEQALAHPQVVGLAIGTRPDCVPDDVLDLLQEIVEREPLPHVAEFLRNSELASRRDAATWSPSRTYLSVEYGMQTMHDRSLDWMNRGHHHDAMIDAVQRSRGRGFEICAHLILGLPSESHADMLASAREVARLGIDAVKIHNLYCVRNTPLAEQVAAGDVLLMNRDDYVRTLVDVLELLPPHMVVERISGDAPPDYFIGPSWCLDKPAVRLAVQQEMERRDTWQGKRCSH